MKPVLVIGIGNLIQKDDGIGVHVIEEMKKMKFSDEVELFDGGTAGFDLTGIFNGRKKAIIIDTVKGNNPPGSIYRFKPEDISTQYEYDSLHQLGIIDTLEIAKLLGKSPDETIIIGVEPENIGWGLEPSETIKEKIPEIISLVIKELNTIGMRSETLRN